VALSFLVGPGERDDHPVGSRLDMIEAVVPIAELAPGSYPFFEDLTGLVRAVSGRRSPESGESAAPAPLHVSVDERDERLYVAAPQCLISRADQFGAHVLRILRSVSAYPWRRLTLV
jgi:hypothetical protein